MRIEDLTDVAVPEQPALSPDATRCVYVLCEIDADEDRSVRSLWSVGATAGEARRLTNGPADSSPTWSPTARRSRSFARPTARHRSG